jgi:hypothetical protein
MSGVEIFEQRAGVSVASSAVPVGSEVRKVAPFEVGARLGSSVEKRDRGYWAQRRSSEMRLIAAASVRLRTVVLNDVPPLLPPRYLLLYLGEHPTRSCYELAAVLSVNVPCLPWS